MIFPQALKVGDKIGFFSPSSPATAFAPVRFRRAKSYLESQGFELVEGISQAALIHIVLAQFKIAQKS